MRLGINATFLSDRPAGVDLFTREVSCQLCRINRETTLFASKNIGSCNTLKTPKGIRGSICLVNNVSRFIYINTVLPLLIKRHRLDVLYCPMVEFPFVPVKARLVVTIHDLHPLYFPEQFGLSSDHFKWALRILPLLARRVTVPSNFVRHELLRICPSLRPDQIDVVYNGYDRQRFYPRIADMKRPILSSYNIRPPYILFVGSLFEYKNLKALVKAYLEVKDVIPHCLVVVGKQEVAKGPLTEDDRILYLDYVKAEDLPYLYSYADVFVHPALFEGFGLAVIEAMACGVPVLSSNGGSLPEVCGDGALLFEPHDSDQLKALLLEVIGNEELRRDMKKRGLENIRRFSWEKTAQGIMSSCELALQV